MTKTQSTFGSNFDDFLAEDRLVEEASAIAIKRVIAWQLAQAMKAKGLSKLSVAKRMGTSRSHLDRILNATDAGLRLETLRGAGNTVGCQVTVTLTASEQWNQWARPFSRSPTAHTSYGMRQSRMPKHRRACSATETAQSLPNPPASEARPAARAASISA
ncbi:MAG: helix-turn-helix domain-containing protein [Aquimonas sp.]|nr:helix-turn-helix domain-containing protein [Aquimonas sp.]